MSTHVIVAALFAAGIAASFSFPAGAAPVAGDPVQGEELYAACAYCHSLDANQVGPTHHGLFGRVAGTVPGYTYSAAMKKAGADGLVWTAETLDRYLTDPQKVVPGNKMLFGGISDPQERADLIAYLQKATATSAPASAKSH